MDYIPLELINTFEEYNLYLTCKTYYALLPSMRGCITYPEYLECINKGDIILLYRSKGAHTWYRDEPVNTKETMFCGYLKRHNLGVFAKGQYGVLYPYNLNKKLLAALEDTSIPTNRLMMSCDILHLTAWAMEHKHPRAEELFEKCRTSGKNSVAVCYYAIKNGYWNPNIDYDTDFLVRMYEYGYTQVKFTDSRYMGVISHDYPNMIRDILRTSCSKNVCEYVYEDARKINSRMLLKLGKRLPHLNMKLVGWLCTKLREDVVKVVDKDSRYYLFALRPELVDNAADVLEMVVESESHYDHVSSKKLLACKKDVTVQDVESVINMCSKFPDYMSPLYRVLKLLFEIRPLDSAFIREFYLQNKTDVLEKVQRKFLVS